MTFNDTEMSYDYVCHWLLVSSLHFESRSQNKVVQVLVQASSRF